MGWFNKKQDPISQRAKDLNSQIKKLEAQIQDLSVRAAHPEVSTDLNRASAESKRAIGSAHPTEDPARRDPVFEAVNQHRLQDLTPRPAQFNDLGVKKYDLPAAWRRLSEQMRGPSSKNPKLVDLLAAGAIQGMRPLRYEKRIARRRFVVFFILLLLVLWGTAAVLWRGR